MRIKEVIVELKTHSQDRIRETVFAHADFKKSLAEVSTEIESRVDLGCVIIIARVIQLLAQPPAGPPGILLNLVLVRSENPLSINVT